MALSSPLKLPCGITLKNRCAKAAMTENLADPHGRATERHCTLYRAWANGGCGLLVTGNVQIDRRFLERPGNITIDGEQDAQALGALRKLALAGSVNSTQIWVQLGHAGRQSTAKVNKQPVGPSAVPLEGIPTFAVGHPRALTLAEVDAIPARFAQAALYCQDCGFGGVQIHAAHGFLNPRANKRTDHYGPCTAADATESLQNRSRLLLLVVRAVRGVVDDKFAVSVKLNSADFQKGGFEHHEAVQVACMLAGERVDLLELSGGNYEMPTIIGNKQSIARAEGDADGFKQIQESTRQREAYYLLYCRDVGAALEAQAASAATADGQMALMLTGGFRSRHAMEAAVREGDLDVVGLGRPLCGSPACVQQLLEGTIEVLPGYEDSLQPGGAGYAGRCSEPCVLAAEELIGRALRAMLSTFKLGRTLLFIATQSWYYVSIYNIADQQEQTVGNMEQVGCFGALIRNEREEGRMAAALLGVDSVGTHYAGPNGTQGMGLLTKSVLLAAVFLSVWVAVGS